MLEVSDLAVRYGPIDALHGASLHVRPGEFVGILGRNGAGKTTLLECMAGVRRAHRGTVLVDGEDVGRLGPHKRVRRGIALVQQGKRIFRSQSVIDNLLLGAYVTRARRNQVEDDLEAVLALFPVLSSRLRMTAGLLSGGQQQMLAVGQALMSRPRYLLLDEPSAGLAPVIVEELFGTLSSADRGDMGVLLVEQLLNQTLEVCSRAYVLDTGSIVLEGPSETLAHEDHVQQIYMA